MSKSTTYLYVHMCIHILKQKGMEATGVKSGVQSQEDVNIPVSFKSMQVVGGIYVIKQCEYQCLIQYFGPVWFIMLW